MTGTGPYVYLKRSEMQNLLEAAVTCEEIRILI